MYSLWDNFITIARTSLTTGSNYNGEAGLPHSEICGSKVAHTSPQLIAACHVLHRLCMPRHPRIALTSRLRVYTSNDKTDRPITHDGACAVRVAANMQIKPQPDILVHQTSDEDRYTVFTASISKPIHNVKEVRILADPDRPKPDSLSSFLECTCGQPFGGAWWSLSGSNRRPQACKASALPTELRPLGAFACDHC